MRAVFDTNIFVSALVIPGSRAEQALYKVIEGDDRLLLSKLLIDELLGVLARNFSRDREQLSRLALFLAEAGELIQPEMRFATLADEPDNRLLECAVAGRADLIVTGDRAVLGLGQHEGIVLVTLREYLEPEE